MSTTLRTASFCIAAALLAACGRDAVERKLVGTWQTAVASPTGAYELRFTTQPNGQYRTDALGAAAVPPEFGYLRATGGKWLLQRPTGSDEGTYEFVSVDSVLFKSKAGVVLWTRLPNNAAAGVAATLATPSRPASPVASSPGLGAMPGSLSSGTGEPSAALLATGPFGPALGESAAATPAFGGAAGGAPAVAGFAPAGGGPAATGFAPGGGVPATAGFAPAAQSPPNSPHATAQLPPNQPAAMPGPPPTMTTKQAVANMRGSVQQTASQTVASARAGAQQIESQAATSATDAVNGAAAETNKKVGQKIGTFAGNVGSKIKNFFTGGKRNNADSGDTDGAAQQQDAH
jgi:hypothetical protein